MGRRSVSGAALASTLLALACVAAGCGGGGGKASAAATGTTTTSTRRGAASAFQACLKEHGVTLSFPRGGTRFRGQNGQGGRPPGGGAPTTTTPSTTTPAPPAGTRAGGGFRRLTAKQRQAFQACQSKLPAGQRGFGGRPGANGPGSTNPATGAAFRSYTTCLRKHGVRFGSASKPSTFAKATAACKSLLPAGGSARTPPPTTTTK